jgi:DNA-binding NtrC family response regulator
MIASHGGTLNVESEWGHGTAFTITLPIIKVEEEKKKGEEVEKSLKGLKGLVIDDDISIITLTSRYLRSQGCEIETAQNVKDALNIIEGKEFDFVLCDIRMPEMGGDDFYRIVGERKPRLKDRIILMTGDTLGSKTRAFISSTKNLLIEKPFNLDKLKKVVIDLQRVMEEKP